MRLLLCLLCCSQKVNSSPSPEKFDSLFVYCCDMDLLLCDLLLCKFVSINCYIYLLLCEFVAMCVIVVCVCLLLGLFVIVLLCWFVMMLVKV